MIVKVCGMRDGGNISDVISLGVDMVGFILYPPSPRYVVGRDVVSTQGVDRVGVFVNEEFATIMQRAKEFSLSHIQLHGAESVEMCRAVSQAGYRVIKAVSISSPSDFDVAEQYDGEVDMMLFDTKCVGYGGSGESFDWSMLSLYRGATPFLLSGGIDVEDGDAINSIQHSAFAGVDLNSRFEDSPAVKNIEKLEKFIKSIR